MRRIKASEDSRALILLTLLDASSSRSSTVPGYWVIIARMLELPGVKILIAYLLGTLLGSLILGRLRGVDNSSMGSGNAGATNPKRTQGKLFGVLVLLIDIAKGMIAVWWSPSAASAPASRLMWAFPESGSRWHAGLR